MRMTTALVATTLLAGCSTTAPVDPPKLRNPDAALMVPPADLPTIPKNEGNRQSRASYYAESRKVCGGDGVRLRQLQTYVRTVTQ